jgi:hypothetical protein
MAISSHNRINKQIVLAMKKVISIIAIASFIVSPVFSQNDEKEQKLENLENKYYKEAPKDTVSVVIGEEIFSVKETGDETRVTLGNKEYRVVEDNDGFTVFKSDKRNGGDKELYHRKHDSFRGHLGGIEFGFNGFLTDYWSTTLDPEDIYFDINTAKSNVWNFLFPNINLGLGRHIGFVSTIGLNFNSYRFDGNNNITKNSYGEIGPLYPDSGIIYTKSKLYTTYLTLPLILEGQIPVNGSHHKTLNIGAGVIGAVKLCSKNKVVFDDGDKQKAKSKDDFSMNVLRWGATARLGYDQFQVFGTTYFTQLFEKGKGPELYPYEVGIAFTFN